MSGSAKWDGWDGGSLVAWKCTDAVFDGETLVGIRATGVGAGGVPGDSVFLLMRTSDIIELAMFAARAGQRDSGP